MSEIQGRTESSERAPEEIREEIEDNREELGETVAAAAEKADVKQQAQAKAKELGDKVKASAPKSPDEAKALAEQNPKPLAIAGGVVALLVLWRLLRR